MSLAAILALVTRYGPTVLALLERYGPTIEADIAPLLSTSLDNGTLLADAKALLVKVGPLMPAIEAALGRGSLAADVEALLGVIGPLVPALHGLETLGELASALGSGGGAAVESPAMEAAARPDKHGGR